MAACSAPKLTLHEFTPGTLLIAFSTLLAQEAQLIPLSLRFIFSVCVVVFMIGTEEKFIQAGG